MSEQKLDSKQNQKESTVSSDIQTVVRRRGRFLSNIHDPADPKARMYLTHSHEAMFAGKDACDEEWQRHLDWINRSVIGPPKATKSYTPEELKKMGMVGIYAPA